MSYAILTGEARSLDSTHDTGAAAISVAHELIRQGRPEVCLVDGDGIIRNIVEFERFIAEGGGSDA